MAFPTPILIQSSEIFRYFGIIREIFSSAFFFAYLLLAAPAPLYFSLWNSPKGVPSSSSPLIGLLLFLQSVKCCTLIGVVDHQRSFASEPNRLQRLLVLDGPCTLHACGPLSCSVSLFRNRASCSHFFFAFLET